MENHITPSLHPYKDLGAFRFWCQKVLPLVYDDSLSYYELLCKVVNYLNETINNVNLVGEDMVKLHNACELLESYVYNYFDELDVSQEVNRKLDTMFANGAITELIQPINTQLDALNARMDTFTSLPAGSTAGDAELTDIRVGFNGNLHSSAGSSVRAGDQFNYEHANIMSDIQARVSEDNSYNMKHYTSLLDSIGFVTGGYLHKDGDISGDGSLNKCEVSNYVSLTEYPVLYITGGYIYQSAVVTLYNALKIPVGAIWGGAISGESGYDVYHPWSRHRFTLADAQKIHPQATYARFGAFIDGDLYPNHLNIEVVDTENSYNATQTEALVFECVDANINTKITKFNSILEKVGYTTGVYLSGEKGTTVDGFSGAITTNFIDIREYPEMFVTGFYRASTAIMGVYDANKKFIKAVWANAPKTDPMYDTIQKWDRVRVSALGVYNLAPEGRYVRFCSWRSDSLPMCLEVCTAIRESSGADGGENNGNVLYGKKYIACGDSWTCGDFTTWDGDTTDYTQNPDYFDSELNTFKTYPWWIAKRNRMELVNEAIGGSTMALVKGEWPGTTGSPETRSPFSYERYKNIPTDADYITIMFGINDAEHTNLGTIDDVWNGTFYGAYNVVLSSLIASRPYAKIGLIVEPYGKAEYRQAVRDIGKKFGVPVLDMMGDDVTNMFGSENGIDDGALEARKLNFINLNNGHPNLKAYEYMSTFIEAFLRRL